MPHPRAGTKNWIGDTDASGVVGHCKGGDMGCPFVMSAVGGPEAP